MATSKLLSLLLCLCLYSAPLRAALSAATVWEIRTTGAAANGGGFVAGATGTDFSQQDAAQYTFTNLASANGTTNPCTVSSASHNFVAADVGNLLHVTAGTNWTQNFFQIVSVAANAATLDRACGSAAGLSNGTFAVGGAVVSIATVLGATGRVGSNKIFVKAGAGFTTTATITLNTSVTPASTVPPNRLIGYTTTRGDNGRVTLTLSTNTGLTALNGGAATGWYVENFNINCASLGTSTGIAIGEQSYIVNSKVSNCTTAGASLVSVNFAGLLDSEVTGCTAACTAAVLQTGSTAQFLRNWIHDNASPGLQVTQRATVLFNVFSNITGASSDCILSGASDGSVFMNNTIFACGRDGLRITSDNLVNQITIRNNIIVNAAGAGITGGANPGSPALPFYDGNGFFNNTGGNRVNMDDTGTVVPINAAAPYTNIYDVVLSASPFTNTATNDYSLNSVAGGGTALKGTGTPGPLPGLSQTGAIDFGAIQASCVAGLGGSNLGCKISK